jgi:hypothetical protein
MTKDKMALYAFGGSHDSVERLELPSKVSWILLNVQFPDGKTFEGGLTMLPMWYYCSKLENIS